MRLRALPRNADGFVAVCSRRGCGKIAWSGETCTPECEGSPDPPILQRDLDPAASLFFRGSPTPPSGHVVRCAWCLTDFVAKRPNAKTCSGACRKALHVYRREHGGQDPSNGSEHLKPAVGSRP